MERNPTLNPILFFFFPMKEHLAPFSPFQDFYRIASRRLRVAEADFSRNSNFL